jgi:peptidylprolyl isomerase
VTGGDDNARAAAEDSSSPKRAGVVLASLIAVAAVANLGLAVANVALPSIGKEFDASWDRGEPFTFTLGAGEVIPGWDQGVEGMRVGGRRELIIPPSLGYGSTGSPPVIPPDETLVFVVDLVGVE